MKFDAEKLREDISAVEKRKYLDGPMLRLIEAAQYALKVQESGIVDAGKAMIETGPCGWREDEWLAFKLAHAKLETPDE